MRVLYIKILSIIVLISLIFVCAITTAGSYNYYTYSEYSNCGNMRLLKGDNQAYLIGETSNCVFIEAVYPDTYSAELTTEYDVYSYNLFGDILVLVCPDSVNEQTQIILYDIYYDSVTSFVINGYICYESTQICYCNNYLYLSDDSGTIKQYSMRGKLVNTYNSNAGFTQLLCDDSNNIYAVTYKGVYSFVNGTFSMLYNSYVEAPLQAVGDDIFINTVGSYYRISVNNVSKLTNTQSSAYYPSGGVISNHAIICDDNTIYAYDINSTKADRYIELSNYIEEVYVINSYIVSLTYQNGAPVVSIIPYDEMNIIKQEDTEDNSSDGENDNYDNNSTPVIESDVYTIDNDRNVITDIPHSTTIAQFKKNIRYDGFSVRFTKHDGKVIKSGNVGTAMIVEFYNDNYSVEYELSVIGDITGEGNVNSKDRKTLFSYLLDEITFTGVYIDSADIDKSGKIDIVDTILLLRLIGE